MFNHFHVAVAVLALSMAPFASANAVDITNQDETSHLVVISTDSDDRELEIGAGETLQDVCAKCAIQVGDSDPLETEGNELVLIQDGVPTLGQ